jgi:Tfp pilus assembly protein PilW
MLAMRKRLDSILRDEDGLTIIELLATIPAMIAVLAATGMMVTTSLHNQDRINKRVDANQRARPVMTQIVQALHSACVAPRIVPVLAGSTGTSISFLSQPGSAVSPTPDLHVISLSGTTLTDTTYPATGGAAPNWTFSGTSSGPPRQLLTNVAAPGGTMFRYYQFVNGSLSPTTLTTPLSPVDAAHTANVDVSFTSSPTSGPGLDANSPLMLNDSVDLRLEAAGQYPNQDNLPCV